MVNAPLIMNFMFPVPGAFLPAVEICSDRLAAGYTRCALCTVKFGRNTTFINRLTAGSAFTVSPTALISLMIRLAMK
jgi:hypothetical protein